MEDKIKAIEDQIKKLRGEKEEHSSKVQGSKNKRILQQKLTFELIDKVIDDLEHRKEELSRIMKAPPKG